MSKFLPMSATLKANNSLESDVTAIRNRSSSLSPLASTQTIDSQKAGSQDKALQKDTWRADTETDLLNIEEYKLKCARAKHWKDFKNDLKKYVAKDRNEAAARKFEIDIKFIGR